MRIRKIENIHSYACIEGGGSSGACWHWYAIFMEVSFKEISIHCKYYNFKEAY